MMLLLLLMLLLLMLLLLMLLLLLLLFGVDPAFDVAWEQRNVGGDVIDQPKTHDLLQPLRTDAMGLRDLLKGSK